MEDEIRVLIKKVIEDVEIFDKGLSAKDRLPLEIMALNAVANAYEKISKNK